MKIVVFHFGFFFVGEPVAHVGRWRADCAIGQSVEQRVTRTRAQESSISRSFLRSAKSFVQNRAILLRLRGLARHRILVRLPRARECRTVPCLAAIALRENGTRNPCALAYLSNSRSYSTFPKIFDVKQRKICATRRESDFPRHLAAAMRRMGVPATSKLWQCKPETFNFCGAMWVPRPLKYTKNGGSLIAYRPGFCGEILIRVTSRDRYEHSGLRHRGDLSVLL